MARGGKRPGAGRKPGSRNKNTKKKRPITPKMRAIRAAAAERRAAAAKLRAAPIAAPKPAAPFVVIEGGEGRLQEPDWSALFTDELDVAIARDQWSTIVRELRDNEKLATANAHQVRRLVIDYVFHEIAVRHVAEEGPVFPRKGKKQPAYNPWWTILKDANAMASAAEAELTITPRRRNNGGKVQRKAKRLTASDEFLKPVAIGPGHTMGQKSG